MQTRLLHQLGSMADHLNQIQHCNLRVSHAFRKEKCLHSQSSCGEPLHTSDNWIMLSVLLAWFPCTLHVCAKKDCNAGINGFWWTSDFQKLLTRVKSDLLDFLDSLTPPWLPALTADFVKLSKPLEPLEALPRSHAHGACLVRDCGRNKQYASMCLEQHMCT